MGISRDTIRQTSEILTPHFQSVATRRSLIFSAFMGTSVGDQINYDGGAANFTQHVIQTLMTYDEIEPGTPALVALLQEIKRMVGVNKQRQIDTLITTIRNELAGNGSPNNSTQNSPSSGNTTINIHGNVTGGNVNIGGNQQIQGDTSIKPDS